MVKKLSKFFNHPTLWVGVFIFGSITGLFFDKRALFVMVPLGFLGVILLLFGRKILAGMLLVFAISILTSQIQTGISNMDRLTPGCYKGTVSSNPDIRDNWSRFVFSAGEGRAVVETSGENFSYKDKINLCFSEDQIKNNDIDRSRFYLSRFKTDLVLKNPEIDVESNQSSLLGSIYRISDSISKKTKLLWPGDKGVLAKGLVLGGSQEFSEETSENLKRSGTSHLTAVSGYNVAIITVVLFNLIRLASKKLAFGVTVSVLIVFVFLTGLSASVLRASLMGALYLLGKMIGRPKAGLHFLVLAAFVLLSLNPYIIFDVGFLLSFAATFGLFVGADKFKYLLDKIKNGAAKALAGIAVETTVAQIFVLPILLYYFGQVSLISLISNILILPLIPVAMLAIFISTVFSYLSFWLGLFAAKAIEPLLAYILAIINSLGSLNWAAYEINLSSPVWVVILYAIILMAFIVPKNMFWSNEKK